MNGSIALALLRDAFAQILDNRIFRLMVILVFGMVLFTFLFGFEEDRIVLLFGMREFDYDSILSALGGVPAQIEKPNEWLVGSLQRLFVQQLAGTGGMVFCLAATAFFLPQMLEKGAADTVFSKPVSRLTLMMARYFSGVLFVGILSFCLVAGMHLGLLWNSGYSDPGFLWSFPILVYLFAPLYGVSILAGIVTRSAVAAIIVSLMFFFFTGCVVHPVWRFKEWTQAGELSKQIAAMDLDESGEVEEPVVEEPGALLRAGIFVLDTLHYTLPKTSDADIISERLRKEFGDLRKAYRDNVSGLSLDAEPEGFVRDEPFGEIGDEGLAWRSEHGTRGGDARIELRRIPRERPAEEGEDEDGRRRRRWTLSSYSKAYEKEVEALPTAIDIDRSFSKASIANLATCAVSWTLDEGGTLGFRETYMVFIPDYGFEIEITGPEEWVHDAESRAPVNAFLSDLSFDSNPGSYPSPGAWYEKQVGWNAKLRFNLFFSIGSTIAFTIACLLFSWWRLSRIDF